MKNYIVIPTYKEAENLKDLLPLLKKYKVIIVDDNSSDGTKDLCKKYTNVKLIERKGKLGLASAVKEGILYIKDKDAKVVVMDADFQHDPSKIPEFFRKLDKSDFVYGLRNRLNMPLYRRIMSRTAKAIAKILITETKGISDPMSGYFGFRMESVNVDKIKPEGYKIMLDIITNLKKDAKLDFVKYDFNNRRSGNSKIGVNVILDFIRQSLRLNHYRMLMFILVGLSGVVVNEGIAFALHPYLPLYILFISSAEISIITNFVLNHWFTFKKRTKFTKALPRYNLIALFGLTINVLVALYLSFFIYYLAANLVGIILAFAFNYSLSEVFAWERY